MDAQTATEVGKVITTINWEGVILIISVVVAALIPVYKWIFSQTKEKKEGKEPLTKADLEIIVSTIKPTTCLFDRRVLENVVEKVIENKELLRDVIDQMKTDTSTANRVEDNVERVRKNLADLVESLRKNMR